MSTRWAALVALVVAVGAGLGWRAAERAAVARWLGIAAAAPAAGDWFGESETIVTGERPLRTRVRVVHHAPDRTRLDYLGPDLAGLAVIDRGGTSYRLDPRLDHPVAAPSGSDLPVSLDGWSAWLGPPETIAGRPTRQVRLARGGYRRILSLDVASGAVLRSISTRRGGDRTETRFLTFSTGRPAEGVDFDVPADAVVQAAPLAPSELSRRLGFPVAEPRWLPAGFRLVGTSLCDCTCGCGGCTAQLVYGDGIESLSIFAGGESCAGCFASRSACQACAAHGACVAPEHGDLTVVARLDGTPRLVVVGDLSERILARVLESIEP